jgi:hypothetical protein
MRHRPLRMLPVRPRIGAEGDVVGTPIDAERCDRSSTAEAVNRGEQLVPRMTGQYVEKFF